MKSAMRLLVTALACAAAAVAAAQTRPAQPTVDDRGKDGDIRYYRVRCTDGKTVRTLEANHKEGRICFIVQGGKTCLTTQDTDAAALRACGTR